MLPGNPHTLFYGHLLVTLQFPTYFYSTLSSLSTETHTLPCVPCWTCSHLKIRLQNELMWWFPRSWWALIRPLEARVQMPLVRAKEAALCAPGHPWPGPAASLPWAISSCRFASPSAENRSSLILVSALRLFSRCCVLSCMAERADINTSVSFSFSLYFRSSYQHHQSSNVTTQFWHWCLQIWNHK